MRKEKFWWRLSKNERPLGNSEPYLFALDFLINGGLIVKVIC